LPGATRESLEEAKTAESMTIIYGGDAVISREILDW